MKKGTKILSLLLVFILSFSLTGCSKAKNTTITKQADIVVVGGGTSGLATAVEAASQGKKVILLEKQAALGGGGQFAEGVFAVDSPVQKSMGINANVQQIERTLLESSHYRINTKAWEQIIAGSAANIEWLLSLGIKFSGVASVGIVGEKTWHTYAGGNGSPVIKAFAAKAEDLGVEVMLNTPGKELIMQNGKVAGVKATSDGQEIVINAKAVVIATGGFAANKDMVAQKTDIDPSKLYYAGVPGLTGDGINMAAKVGAVSYGTPMLTVMPGVEGYSINTQMYAAGAMEPNNLWVNQDGVRFVNEDITLHPPLAANAILVSPLTFSIIDSDSVKRLVEQGCVFGGGASVPPGSKLDKLNEDLQAALDKKSPYVFKADTLEQLANQMGIDAAAFTATVNKYNEECAKGVDSEYGKDATYMATVKTGPFYGFRLKGWYINTIGGIAVNLKNEVLGAENKPIPGLYAAGLDCDGFEGDTYCMEVPGSQQAIAMLTGKNAAVNAVKYVSN